VITDRSVTQQLARPRTELERELEPVNPDKTNFFFQKMHDAKKNILFPTYIIIYFISTPRLLLLAGT